ncbi:MAG: glycosyltransferase [Polyangiaceae bacterium]|nr:glycosyltransferase [Polyangiaceae bacterium]
MCEVRVLRLMPRYPGMDLAMGLLGKSGPTRAQGLKPFNGIEVSYVPVFYLPKVGQAAAGVTYAASVLPRVWRLRDQVDVVLGSFAFPDGWAALQMGRLLGVPTVIKVHGSDINVQGDALHLRALTAAALRGASAVVGPSEALIRRCVELGANSERARVIHNGVDRALFRVRNAAGCRAQLGRRLDRRVVLFVGRLSAPKGVHELLEAFRSVSLAHPDVDLVLVGDGDDRKRCAEFVADQRLPVHLEGVCTQERVALWMGAADIVTLPSWREGTPNVVLEALASGRRVVASSVGGIPAVVHQPLLGKHVPARDSVSLAEALTSALTEDYDPERVAAASGIGGWEESAATLHDVLEFAVRNHRCE